MDADGYLFQYVQKNIPAPESGRAVSEPAGLLRGHLGVGSGWLGMIFSGAAPDAPHQRCFDFPRHGAYRRAIAEKNPRPEDRDGEYAGRAEVNYLSP